MTAQQEQVGLREMATIAFPGTEAPGTAWDLYNQMIAGIPEGVFVRDYCLGLNWSYVEADCGMGVAFTVRGGGKRTYKMDLRGMELRQVAELSKSWCFQEATLGIAALNAWYSRRELLAPLGCEFADPAEHHGEDERGGNGQKDAFCAYKPQIAMRTSWLWGISHMWRISPSMRTSPFWSGTAATALTRPTRGAST